jgi:hypothetical protein
MINIDVQSEQSIMLRTRVPAWVQTMNGKKIERAALDHGYLSIPTSPGGSSVHLALDLPVERMHADPRVKAAAGRVAFMRGPLVYCVEAPDNSVDLASAVVPPVGEAKATKGSVDGLGEIVSLTIPAERVVAQPADTLYRAAPRAEASTLKAVPYFMWANRVPGGKSGAMMVWLPESSQFLPTGSVPGVKATASYIGNGEGPFAACDRTAPAHSNDQTIPRHTTWPRKGGAKEALPGGEWVQYDFDAPKTIGQTSVYWFDDTGTGECRVPASCTLEFKDSAGTWKPVQSAGTPATVGVEKDTFNSASFDPIVAHGLRITFQLQPNCSTGVLEWTFGK